MRAEDQNEAVDRLETPRMLVFSQMHVCRRHGHKEDYQQLLVGLEGNQILWACPLNCEQLTMENGWQTSFPIISFITFITKASLYSLYSLYSIEKKSIKCISIIPSPSIQY